MTLFAWSIPHIISTEFGSNPDAKLSVETIYYIFKIMTFITCSTMVFISVHQISRGEYMRALLIFFGAVLVGAAPQLAEIFI